jgi:hypothetical protein
MRVPLIFWAKIPLDKIPSYVILLMQAEEIQTCAYTRTRSHERVFRFLCP